MNVYVCVWMYTIYITASCSEVKNKLLVIYDLKYVEETASNGMKLCYLQVPSLNAYDSPRLLRTGLQKRQEESKL